MSSPQYPSGTSSGLPDSSLSHATDGCSLCPSGTPQLWLQTHPHSLETISLLSARFRREWDIQTSLVDAFVTFFILSTTKLFNVSFELLMPTTLHVANGDTLGLHLYYDANIEYMKHQHIYYALLALTVLGIFLVLPLSLIVLSTFSCVRGRLRFRIMRDFLHTLQMYYKDGTNGTRDCRWIAGYYPASLFGAYLLYAFTLNGYFYVITTVYYIIAAIIVLLVEPYKEEYAMYNTLDSVLYLWHALFTLSITLLNEVANLQRRFTVFAIVVIALVSVVPLLLIAGVAGHWILRRMKCIKTMSETSDLEASLAHRITNSNEYRDSCGYVTLRRGIVNQ